MSRKYIPCPFIMAGRPCRFGKDCYFSHESEFAAEVYAFSRKLFKDKYEKQEDEEMEIKKIKQAADRSREDYDDESDRGKRRSRSRARGYSRY